MHLGTLHLFNKNYLREQQEIYFFLKICGKVEKDMFDMKKTREI